MRNILAILVNKLVGINKIVGSVIPWGSPIPFFGNPYEAKLATVGLNPSNREFVDEEGNELDGTVRRFHTLGSLGLQDWLDVNCEQLGMIEDSCTSYFQRNPYNIWFKDLDKLISGTHFSYYTDSPRACHLDLVPFATHTKWTELSLKQRTCLLDNSGEVLGMVLKDSPIQLLVLNGNGVVKNLERLVDTEFQVETMPNWTLPRNSGDGVTGYAYMGSFSEVGDINLNKEVLILGFNHNLQSSFGVTNNVKQSIRNWVTVTAGELDW